MAGRSVHTELKLGEIRIRIHWLIAVCVALTVALLINLGFWQLGRAADKRGLQQAMEQRQLEAPMPLATLMPRVGPLSEEQSNEVDNLSVRAAGRYWNAASFVVAFQFFQGAPGFELITPFELEDGGEFVLVSRGWVTPGPGADGMPYIPPIEGPQILRGQLHVPPTLLSPSQVEGDGWPLRLRSLDLGRAAQLMERPLLPWVVRLGANEPGVFARHWPAVAVNTRMHIQYALQWFGMALIVLAVAFLMSSNFLALQRRAKV